MMSDPKHLGWDKELNPSLYKMYAKKLLKKGWAGRYSPEEKEYRRRYASKSKETEVC